MGKAALRIYQGSVWKRQSFYVDLTGGTIQMITKKWSSLELVEE